MGVFNAVHKLCLSTCLRMRSTPEEDKIDSKRIRVNVMNKKVEVRFSKECKRLLYICDKIGTKGDNKYVKLEAKALLNYKYYWVHKEEDTRFNCMKAVYNILNNQDKVTMKHFYHIICNPDLDKCLCSM